MKNLRLTPVLIPTEGASELYILNDKLTLAEKAKRFESHKSQHLYLCSNLPIKEGEWKYCSFTNSVTKYDPLAIMEGTGKCEDCKKISFATDPKLIADGVPAIDGNTKAIKRTGMLDMEINFLPEFVKRYNRKQFSNNVVGEMEKLTKDDNQKGVDVEKLALEIHQHYYDDDKSMSAYDKKHIVDILNKSLQSNAEGFSEKNLIKAIGMSVIKNTDGSFFYTTNEIVECIKNENSLTKEQPKGDIVIECEMDISKSMDKIKFPDKIKLKDGQPILIFK